MSVKDQPERLTSPSNSFEGFPAITLEEALLLLEKERLRCQQLETRLEEVQARFQQSLSLFQQLFNNSSDANMLFSQAGFVACNQAALDMVGCDSEDQFLNLNVLDISPEYQPDGQRSGDIAPRLIAAAFEDGDQRFEWLHRRLNGEDLWVEVLLIRIEVEGQPMLHATWRDISERKAAEAALAESEAKFRRMVEDANDLLYIVDLDGNFTYLSPQFTQVWGYEISEWLHQPFAPLVHPEDLPKVATANQQMVITGERSIGLEFRTRRQDGEWLWITCNDSPMLNADGEVMGIQGIARDITEKKNIEQEQARLTAILDATPDFVGIADMQGRTAYMNPAGYKLFEIPADQNIIGQSIDNQMADWAKPAMLEHNIPTAIQDGSWQGETAILTVNGKEVPVSQVIIAHKAEDGTPEYLSTIVRDITAQKQAEAKLQQNAQELEVALQRLQQTQLQMVQSEKMSSLGQLVAGVAHEINNPVGFIYGNIKHIAAYSEDLLNLVTLYRTHYPNPVDPIQDEVEALELDFLAEDMPKTLASIKIGAERIREIVKSLRTFSRLDEAACKAVDIHEGIDSSLVILAHRFKATADRPAVEVVKQYGQLPPVDCYAGKLNQVVMNILTNALDALEERDEARTLEEMKQAPSRITIATRTTDPNYIAIELSDNGPGIPPDVQNRIFDPFFTTKPVGKGTGMGMSISYQIVTENHGGTLTCASSPDGTTFVIEIPRQQALT